MKRQRIFLRIRFYLIAIIVFILLFYLLSFFLNYKNILKNEEEKVEVYTSLIAENLDIILRDIKSDSEYIVELLVNNKEVNKDIERYMKKHNIIKEFFFANKEKIITLSSNKELIDKKATKDLSYLIFPVEEDEKILGYIGIILNFESEDFKIENTFDPFIYKKWNLLLTDKNGYLIYHSNMMLENIKDKNFSNYPSVSLALSGNWGLNRVKINNKNFYTYSQFLKTTDWLLIIDIDREKIIKSLILEILPFFFFGILMVTLFFIGYIIIHNILFRIENITNFINTYPSNKINKLIEKEEQKNDEISGLYYSFKNMIKKREEQEKEILQTIENERKRIGIDLHDDLGQTLTGISFQLMLLEQELKLEKNKIFHEIVDLLEKSILKTKTIAKGLSPLSIYENNIFVAIEDMLKNIESLYNIKYSFQYDIDINFFKQENLIVNLYYILVEILNNIVKHSNANFVLLKIEKNNNGIKILVKDNGIGFNPEIDYKGMGLKSIKYRASLIMADIKISSNSNGTQFEIFIN